MDRYLYDSLANLFNTESDFYTKFMLKIVPKPNLAILLDTKPEVAFNRKPEYPRSFIAKEEKHIYRCLTMCQQEQLSNQTKAR